MFRLVHLSDTHIPLRDRPRRRALVNKRLTGYLNILRSRGATHQMWALEAIVKDIQAHKAGHIVVTGDLVNMSLPAEYAHAREWLEALGSPKEVTVIPGNHDAYIARDHHHGLWEWRHYMVSDEGPPASQPPLNWPFLRRRGPLALIGVSTAVPTMPFRATGRIGTEQLGGMEAMLRDTEAGETCRVLLIHHPPLPVPARASKRLTDASALADALSRTGAELVLHGHNHTDTLYYEEGPAARIPIVGVPSASAIGNDGRPPAQYNIYEIAREGDSWRINMIARRLDPDTRKVATLYEKRIDAAAPQTARGKSDTM